MPTRAEIESQRNTGVQERGATGRFAGLAPGEFFDPSGNITGGKAPSVLSSKSGLKTVKEDRELLFNETPPPTANPPQSNNKPGGGRIVNIGGEDFIQEADGKINKVNKSSNEKSRRGATKTDRDNGTGLTDTEFDNLDLDITDFERDPDSGKLRFKTGIPTDSITQADNNRLRLTNLIESQQRGMQEERNRLLRELQEGNVSAATRDTINETIEITQQRIEQQKEINKSRLALLNTRAIRGGSARFASEVSGGIISKETEAGLNKIVEFNRQKSRIITAARIADEEKKFERINELADQFRELEKDQLIARIELNETMAKEANEAQKQVVAAKKEARDAEKFQIEKEDTTLQELGLITLNALTGDEEVDSQIIAGIAKANGLEPNRLFARVLDLDREDKDSPANLQFIKGSATQSSGVFDPNTGVFKAMKGGIGGSGFAGTPGRLTIKDVENASEEENLNITRVMRLLPTKLKDSEQERADRKVEILRALRSGQGIQDVVDEIKGFVIVDKKNQAFSTYMRTLAAGSGVDLSDLAATINRGNFEKTMTIVENANLERVGGELSGVDSTRTLLTLSNRVLDNLAKAPANNLGVFDGRKFKVKRFSGLTNEEILATQRLETSLVNLFSDIRRKSAGTAVTETELAFLQPLLSDLLDQPEIIKTKIDELKQSTLNTHNEARGQSTLPFVTVEEALNNKERLSLYQEASNQSNRIKIEFTEGENKGKIGTIDLQDFDSNTMEQI